MRLVKIYIFLFVMFFCTFSFARTPKDIDEFRDTTKLAKELWFIANPRYLVNFQRHEIIASHKTSEIAKRLKSCPQIGDGGAIAMVLTLYHGYFSFQSGEILQSGLDSVTKSNCLCCINFSDDLLRQNGVPSNLNWMHRYIVLPITGKKCLILLVP
jgi:hypothetical protein